MSNFFAQPDALAVGKTREELAAEGEPEAMWAHKEFPGNRPSSSLLFPELDAYRLGQLLSLYEHRTAVQVRRSPERAWRETRSQCRAPTPRPHVFGQRHVGGTSVGMRTRQDSSGYAGLYRVVASAVAV